MQGNEQDKKLLCMEAENTELRHRVKKLEDELEKAIEENRILRDRLPRLEGQIEAYQYCIEHRR